MTCSKSESGKSNGRMKERIASIDFARGYAIFTIVCYHALQRAGLPPLWQQAIMFGGTGVHLFFLLSGFGLELSGSYLKVGAFFRRRLTKVWLPYVFALTISLLSAIIFHLFPDGFEAWLAGAGMYQMFSERYIESFGGHFWFVSAILQFYIAFPALLWLKRRLGNRNFFLTALALSVVWWLIVYTAEKSHLRTWNSFFLQFLWEFALGMVLAESYKGGRLQLSCIRKWWWLSLPAGLLFTGAMIVMVLKMGDAGKVFNDIPALGGYAAFCLFAYECSKRFFPFILRFFLWVSGFSYSLYLVHVLVLEVYLRWAGREGMHVNVRVLLPFVVLALFAGWAFEPLSKRWTGLFESKRPA